jgi:hypothetical protein
VNLRRLPAFEIALTSLFFVAVAIAALAGGRPPWAVLALFAGLVFATENAAVMMPSSITVSPGFMLEIAAVTVLADAYGTSTVALAALLIGAAEGLRVKILRQRRWSLVAFNFSQFALSSGAAGLAFSATNGAAPGASVVFAPLAAVCAYAVVNIGLLLPYGELRYDQSPRATWNDIRPALPNFVAFGLLGILVGRMYLELGALALPLILVPAAIARATFSSYLDLRRAHDAAVSVFVRAIEAKDRYTAGHSERVAKFAVYIGEEMAFTPAQLEHLRYAALMHDIGKLAVPSSLLNKPGKLTPEEYDVVRRHNDVCIDILTRVDFLRSTVPAASDKHAHFAAGDERDDIEALEAYAIAVCDAFDAMTSTRSYRKALSQTVAFAELRDKSGSQFHPASVEALIRAIEKRGEHYGDGFEEDVEHFAVAPPVVGVGSAGLGDLLVEDVASA